MCKIKRNSWILQAVTGLSFMRFVLKENGWDIDCGLVLVTDDGRTARQAVKEFIKAVDAREIVKWNSRAVIPFNFEMGIHLYQKSDKPELLIDFLRQDEFLPVVLVGGIVPDILLDNSYVMKLEATNEDIRNFADFYQSMRKFVISKFDFVQQELRNLKTANVIKQCKVEQCYKTFLHALIAVGKIWADFIRDNTEEVTERWWQETYLSSVMFAIREMDRFDGSYEVQDAVRYCVIQYVKTHEEIRICDILERSIEAEQALLRGSAILYDDDFYYIPDALLRNICQPLLSTVSFVQLKSEMFLCGMIECNDIKNQNYTIKKICYLYERNQCRRFRFLKVWKNCLETAEGLALEDLGVYRGETSGSDCNDCKLIERQR